jgi:DNA-directed RNA polymerase subunit M/transcription elongation factor TFIIS
MVEINCEDFTDINSEYRTKLTYYFDSKLSDDIVREVISFTNREIKHNDSSKNIPRSLLKENYSNLLFNINKSYNISNKSYDELDNNEYVSTVDQLKNGTIAVNTIMDITNVQWDPFVNKATADKIKYNEEMSKRKSTITRETCRTCKNNNKYYWVEQQLRGADEGTSIMYMCTACFAIKREN